MHGTKEIGHVKNKRTRFCQIKCANLEVRVKMLFFSFDTKEDNYCIFDIFNGLLRFSKFYEIHRTSSCSSYSTEKIDTFTVLIVREN